MTNTKTTTRKATTVNPEVASADTSSATRARQHDGAAHGQAKLKASGCTLIRTEKVS